jgi:uncharacterized phage protein (TIGR02220 family)
MVQSGEVKAFKEEGNNLVISFAEGIEKTRAMTANKVMEYFNQITQRALSLTESRKKMIVARLKEGFKYDDFVLVIRHKQHQWGNDPNMQEFVRPETLFAPSHFANYLDIAKTAVADARRRKEQSEAGNKKYVEEMKKTQFNQ